MRWPVVIAPGIGDENLAQYRIFGNQRKGSSRMISARWYVTGYY